MLVIDDEVLGKDLNMGYDANKGEYVDMLKAGIIDPVKVVRVALTNAASISGLLLGKAFVVCVIGGLGTVPGALVGGLALGLIESFAGHWFGPQNAVLIGFVLMLALLMTRPTGLLGRRGYE